MNSFIYLASQSPRRAQLLEQLGVRHELLLPDAHEDAEALEAVQPGEAPAAYVRRVTRAKLNAALQRLQRRGLPPAPVLCSDTTVALGRLIYGKPQDHADARRMLAELAGQTHRVLTAVAIGITGITGTAGTAGTTSTANYAGTAQQCELTCVSKVTFAPLSAAQIDAYVATDEPMGKAGAYAVQGRAAAFISQISGSYTGIMGLPLFETAQLLARVGFAL